MRAVDKGKRPLLLGKEKKEGQTGVASLSNEIQSCGILDLMNSCWQQDPNDRPESSSIKEALSQQVALGATNGEKGR